MSEDLFPEVKDKGVKRQESQQGKVLQRPSREELKEALIEHYGDISKVAKSYFYEDGTPLKYKTVYKWIKSYKLDVVPKVIRTQVARSALTVLIEKCIYEKDLRACEMILKRWGKYIGFEDPALMQEALNNTPEIQVIQYNQPNDS